MSHIDKTNLNISQETIRDWESLLAVLANRASVPCALIMRIDLPEIKVCVSSRTKGNPYNAGDKEVLKDSGLYCERVFTTRNKLLVGNALRDPDWDKNPDVKLGMISYFGFPILWPDKEVFGTVCILDSKENYYNKKIETIMLKIKRYIEACLDLLVAQHLAEQATGDRKMLEQEIQEKKLLCCSLLEEASEVIP